MRLGTSVLTIDGILRYRAAYKEYVPPDLVTLFILSIRKQENWEKRATMRLHLFHVWLSRHTAEYLIPFPVLIVENIALEYSRDESG